MFSAAVGMLFVSSSVTMAVPFGIGRVIDIIYTTAKDGHMVEQLTRFCQILLLVFIVGAVANFGRIYLMQMSGNLNANFRESVKASLSYHIISKNLDYVDVSAWNARATDNMQKLQMQYSIS